MKPRILQLSAVVAAAALVAAVASACGGGGSGEELTLEEYFQKLETLAVEFDNRGREAETAFEDAANTVESEEDTAAAVAEFLSAATPIIKDFVDGLEELNPPPEAKAAHDKTVEDGHSTVESFEKTLEEVEGTDDPGELEGIIAASSFIRLGQSTYDFSEDCAALQAVADENNVEVDLLCERESEGD